MLNGRDSKFHITDYDVGGVNLVYSTAEVFTWKFSGSKPVLVLYGGEDEMHEFAVDDRVGHPTNIEGDGVAVQRRGKMIIVQWDAEPTRRVVHFGDDLDVYLLWRNDAYNYWVMDLPAPEPLRLYASPSWANSSVVVKAGYLLRNASMSDDSLYLVGDVNTTTSIELIAAPQDCCSRIFFNGHFLDGTSSSHGRVSGIVPYTSPDISLPDLDTARWQYIDSLPEIYPQYDDSAWTLCNHTSSNNPRISLHQPLSTPATTGTMPAQ